MLEHRCHRRWRVPPIRAAALAAPLVALSLGAATEARAQPFTGSFTVNESSVKIVIDASALTTILDTYPIADFRVHQVGGSGPTTYKYAGRYPGTIGSATTTAYPNLTIEWDRFPAGGGPITLEIEALSGLGPAACVNMVDATVTTQTCTAISGSSCGTDICCYPTGAVATPIGLSEGSTVDGNYSINGQGACDAAPLSIGTMYASVSTNPSFLPIPSAPDAVQSFLDTFDDSASLTLLLNQTPQDGGVDYAPLVPPPCDAGTTGCNLPPYGETSPSCASADGGPDGGQVCSAPASYLGITNYTLPGPNAAWDIFYSAANLDTGAGVSPSVPLFQHGGFQDVLASGPSSAYWPLQADAGLYYDNGNPTAQFGGSSRNERYASMAISPKETADLSNGKVLHVTFEVDSRLEGTNRWVALALAPASDPLTGFRFDDLFPSQPITPGSTPAPNPNSTNPAVNDGMVSLNNGNQALWFQVFDSACDGALFNGPNNAEASDAGSAGSVNFIVPTYTSTYESLFPGIYPAPPGGSPRSGVSACERLLNSQLNGKLPSSAPSGDYEYGGGHGIGSRSRFDVFISSTNLVAFEDGGSEVPAGQSPALVAAAIANTTTTGLPFTQVKIYFIHYGYGMSDTTEGQVITPDGPSETPTKSAYYQSYWRCDGGSCEDGGLAPEETATAHGGPIDGGSFPYTDQRSWDNLGFEVLPAYYMPLLTPSNTAAVVSGLANRITMPPDGGALTTSEP